LYARAKNGVGHAMGTATRRLHALRHKAYTQLTVTASVREGGAVLFESK
jgi:hypothetical protein